MPRGSKPPQLAAGALTILQENASCKIINPSGDHTAAYKEDVAIATAAGGEFSK